ncbi:kinase-like domain-containing protein [Fomitopsis serialis]|uniref:kinase-like domain-containing protein n=1 Tax=Fomitopsis serialis TaxID=139415 RepID=UPI002008D28C|nr:kinase-like domain-containing protein [Neoantrodia serialis]KAH9930885.1 kinase-like domain-containing protein [Neoantrodia serialis]
MLMDEMDIMAWVTKQSRRGLNLGLMGLVESWEDENNVYFVMGLHRGSLRQYMELQCDLALDGADRQKKFELKHVKHHADRFYMAQSIFSLWHLHGAGVVHRDIKPDNLLLDKYGRCTLADFGLVMRADVPGKVSFENVMSSRECGTEEYFAPEQRRALPYNYKVDIWALGCVWVELLAGLDEPWTQHGSFPEKHIVYYRTKGAREGVRESVVELIGEDHPALELVLWVSLLEHERSPTLLGSPTADRPTADDPTGSC